jgi:Rrf2 family cysteine metabolism transcriptional repressor
VRVSAKAEYACVAMVELASQHRTGQPVQIKTIAEAHGISPRFLVQILLQLKGAGLVASSRGSAGGYQLTRAPESIHLAEIINILDRSSRAPSALNALPKSLIVQSLRQVWKDVSLQEQKILERTTLADLVQRAQEQNLPTYQI